MYHATSRSQPCFHNKHGAVDSFPIRVLPPLPRPCVVSLFYLFYFAPPFPARVYAYVRTYHNRELICTDACYHQSLHTTLSFPSFSPVRTGIGRALYTSHTRTHNRPYRQSFSLSTHRSGRISALRPKHTPHPIIAKAIMRKSSHIYPFEAKTT
jgi:hypothetical protein